MTGTLSTRGRALTGGALAAALVGLGAPGWLSSATAMAQQAVVFQHGLNSNGATWAQAADRLGRDYHIAPYRPTTNSFAHFQTQAGQLAAQVAGAGPTTIVVGHSNGGLLSRTANMPAVQGRPWGGIVTVGSPHHGAPLAGSVLSGLAGAYGQYLASSVARPFAYYSWWQASWRDRWYWWTAHEFARQIYNFGVYFPLHIATAGIASSVPVVPQMPPGSAFLGELNSSSNLNREASALPHRISITSTVPTSAGMIWYGLTPSSHRQNTIFQYTAAQLLLATFERYRYYDNYSDPYWADKRYNAWMWLSAAAAVAGMDLAWCALIGATDATGRCTPNDGIVPTWSQVYPNYTSNFNIVGPAHMQETADVQVEGRIRESFNRMGVATCTAVGGVTVSPTTVSLLTGATAQASASVTSVCGRPLSLPVSWQSTNPAIASVSASGVITGVSAGTTTVRASRDGIAATIQVSVTGGGGGPSSVTVSGPSSVYACTADQWYASTTGGMAPLSYQWEFNGHVVETGEEPWVEYQNLGGPGLNVRVTVTDAQGYSKTSAWRYTSIEGLCY